MSVWIIMLFVVLIVSYPLAWRHRPGGHEVKKASRDHSRLLPARDDSNPFAIAASTGSRRVGACPDA